MRSFEGSCSLVLLHGLFARLSRAPANACNGFHTGADRGTIKLDQCEHIALISQRYRRHRGIKRLYQALDAYDAVAEREFGMDIEVDEARRHGRSLALFCCQYSLDRTERLPMNR